MGRIWVEFGLGFRVPGLCLHRWGSVRPLSHYCFILRWHSSRSSVASRDPDHRWRPWSRKLNRGLNRALYLSSPFCFAQPYTRALLPLATMLRRQPLSDADIAPLSHARSLSPSWVRVSGLGVRRVAEKGEQRESGFGRNEDQENESLSP